MRVAVKNVAEYFPTAIISGRSREKVVGEFYNTNNFLPLQCLVVYSHLHTQMQITNFLVRTRF